jgi:Flp pilus assembly pilin Flp
MKKLLKRIFRQEEGQDIIEYGLLAAFISVVALVAIKALAPIIVPLYEAVVTAITP